MQLSNKPLHRPRSTIKLLIASAILVVSQANASDQRFSNTLCVAGEAAQFSCPIGQKIVSLCAKSNAAEIESLTYRFGVPGKVENEYTATKGNGRQFFATVMPAAPGAHVSQLWFDKGNVRYLLTECTGGECVRPAGLAVLRGDKVLMNARCVRGSGNDLAWFNPQLVQFGNDASEVVPSTPLIRSEPTDNNVFELYKTGAPPR